MDVNKQKELLSFLMLSAQRRRTNIICQLTAAETDIYKSAYGKRQALKKLFIAQNSEVPDLVFNANVPRHRNLSKRQRNENDWWTLQQTGNEDMFFNIFRMRKESFSVLCEKLQPFLKSDDKIFRYISIPISIEKQVGICLHKLVSCAKYQEVGDVFGIHKSTVHKYFHLVIKAILQLKSEFIQFPKLQQALEIADEFEKKCHIPNIIGAIDVTHIPILPPNKGFADYINSKGWASFVMQGVVDNNCRFTDVSVQLPGSTHGAQVFTDSDLYKNSDQMIPTFTKIVNNGEVPLFLVGDSAYPLLPWLMKPYGGSLSDDEESFNCHLSSARIVVENAFWRLKGRWGCLTKRIDVDPSFVPSVIDACAILHNFVEEQKESFLDSWGLSAQNDNKYRQPRGANANINVKGKDIRILLKKYLKGNFQLRSSHF